MAIELAKDLDCGVSASYHRIIHITLDLSPQAANPGVDGPLVHVVVGEYATEAARLAGARPVRHEHYAWVLTQQDLLGDVRPVLYSLLAETKYPGATAC